MSGLSDQEDVMIDPEYEAEPLVETAQEKAEREAIYNDTDDNDYQPVIGKSR